MQVKNILDMGNQYLIRYIYVDGDSEETIVQKKLWWSLNMMGLPFLIAMSLMITDKMGIAVAWVNLFFGLAILASLVVFHFHKRNIESYVLFIQVLIFSLTTIKVYLMGGLLEAGGAIFIGLISPLYALATGNRKRAVILYLIYLSAMIIATELQPDTIHNYFLFYYYTGFALGITIAFGGLYYYTGQLERLKKKEKMRMEELDRLKTNFFNHITHELRTPLTIILGMADQVREDPASNLEEGLNMISRNGRKLLNMTNQLLDLSKMEVMLMPVNMVQQDIVGYLKYLVESFHSFAEAREIELSYNTSEEILMMDFDPEKIRDVLTNLISNAIKFTPAGGRVEIRTYKEEKRGEEEFCFQVIDTGPGIAKEHLPKVFERYFQAQRHVDEFTEGTGLGLAITRELVQLMRGGISVSSELNQGTVFTVVLPITNKAEKETIDIQEEPGPTKLELSGGMLGSPSEEHEGKLKLLIVEDSKDVSTYLASLLTPEYNLLRAYNGNEGFKLALEEVPDLIVSDVMMPLMDGFALCRKLKHDIRTSHIPIILLTARNETASKMEGLRSGADAYLGKPFNKEELFVRVDKLIALRKGLRESLQRMMDDAMGKPTSTEFSSESSIIDSHEHEYNFLNRVREILETHLSEDEFGISELSVDLGMSRSQLYRKFSALTDSSVNQFIKSIRLKKARELLRTTDLNVSEVAYDTGFKNPSHFSRVYNQHFGMPPSKEKENVMA